MACREAGDRSNTGDGAPFCMSNVRDLRQRLFDDRGLVFLRHGEPQRKANYPGLQQLTTESWLYTLRDRSAFMHFSEVPGLSGMLGSPLATGDWIATCELAALYCVLDAKKSMKSLSQERIIRVRELAEADQVFLATHDDAPQRFDRKLQMAVTGTGLGRTRGTMTVAADLSLRDLVRYGTTDSVHLSLRWQIRVRNAAKQWVVSLDTIRRFRLPSIVSDSTKDAFLTAMVEVPVPPGMHELKVVISDSAGRVGAEYSRGGMAVGDPAMATDLSDLVLLPDGGLGVPASIEGTAVRISPALSPGRARFLGVGYILTGAADRDIPLTVTVTQLGKVGAAPIVRLRFAERPESARAFRTMRVGIGALKSGSYELRVSAEFSPDRIVERVQRLVVP